MSGKVYADSRMNLEDSSWITTELPEHSISADIAETMIHVTSQRSEGWNRTRARGLINRYSVDNCRDIFQHQWLRYGNVRVNV